MTLFRTFTSLLLLSVPVLGILSLFAMPLTMFGILPQQYLPHSFVAAFFLSYANGFLYVYAEDLGILEE